jgi:hypothetical protein
MNTHENTHEAVDKVIYLWYIAQSTQRRAPWYNSQNGRAEAVEKSTHTVTMGTMYSNVPHVDMTGCQEKACDISVRAQPKQ